MANQRRAYHGLEPDEKLIWTGAPCEYKDYCRADRVILPVSAVILALSTFFAMFLIFNIAHTGLKLWHLLSVLALALVGGLSIYAVFFRFAMKRRNKADFAYGITSRGRVLICDHAEERTYAYWPEDLHDAAVTEQDKRGTGTIYLKPRQFAHLFDNTGMEFLSWNSGIHIALFDVPDCQKVYKMLKPRKGD